MPPDPWQDHDPFSQPRDVRTDALRVLTTTWPNAVDCALGLPGEIRQPGRAHADAWRHRCSGTAPTLQVSVTVLSRASVTVLSGLGYGRMSVEKRAMQLETSLRLPALAMQLSKLVKTLVFRATSVPTRTPKMTAMITARTPQAIPAPVCPGLVAPLVLPRVMAMTPRTTAMIPPRKPRGKKTKDQGARGSAPGCARPRSRQLPRGREGPRQWPTRPGRRRRARQTRPRRRMLPPRLPARRCRPG